jgi:phosphatidylglycerol:prolipoprotein diacylglycerol transferase
MAPYIALAIAIIRIGCFLRGCCHGQETLLPWAINNLHPTQLYESIYSMIIFFILLKFKKIRKTGKKTKFKILLRKKGSLFLSFLLFYSFFRFFNDFLRVYETFFFGLALSQWIALGIFVFSLVFLIKIR